MKNLYKALADFQRECPPILKETEGFGYNYADLPTIFEVIMPLLKKHGLGFTQLLQGEGLETVVFHVESGEEIKSVTTIPQGVQLAKMNTYQVMGSAYTYYKRYALSAILGLVTDKDTDAQEVAPVKQFVSKSPASVIRDSSCSKCGAVMKVSKAGYAYCSVCYAKKKESQRELPTVSYDEPPIPTEPPF